MDLGQQAGGRASPHKAFDRDHINDLVQRLSEVDEAIGATTPKRLINGGIVGIEVPREHLLDAARVIRDSLEFEMLTCISGVDMVSHIESVYHFRAIQQNWLLQVRVKVPTETPEVDSLVSLYPGANWLERECYDMVGITYVGHPDLRRILLDDEFYGYPLRKSFHTTPSVVKDRATTQVGGSRAVSGEQQRDVERIAAHNLGQGNQERLRPGKLTFGSAAVYLETGQGVEPSQDGGRAKADQTGSEGPTMRPQGG